MEVGICLKEKWVAALWFTWVSLFLQVLEFLPGKHYLLKMTNLLIS